MSIFVSDDILGFGAMHSRQSAKVRELEADLESRANAIGRQQVPLSFDPMKARDLDTIQTRGIDDTRKSPQGKPIGANRLLEPTLSDKQKERFAATGLVVQADQTCVTFAQMYQKIFSDELPLLVTTDSVLQAFHQSFDNALASAEESKLMPALKAMAEAMRAVLPGRFAEASSSKDASPLCIQALLDVDLFLAAGLELLDIPTFREPRYDPYLFASFDSKKKKKEAPAPPARTPTPLLLKHENNKAAADTVASWVASATSASGAHQIELFGSKHEIDFSLFKPRGHYTKSGALKQYFKAMSWFNQICWAIDQSATDGGRGVASAIVMTQVLHASAGGWAHYQTVDKLITELVGLSDNGTFDQLHALLLAVDRTLVDDKPPLTDAAIRAVVAALSAGSSLGTQGYAGRAFTVDPAGASGPVVLPRLFAIMGGKFILDGWVTSKVCDPNLAPGLLGRRLPSGVDVAYAVFANDAAAPVLLDRMQRQRKDAHFVPFRDGVRFDGQIGALRATIDALPAAAWSQTIYMRWLGAIRALSPSVDAQPTSGWYERVAEWLDAVVAIEKLNEENRNRSSKHKSVPLPPLPACAFPRGPSVFESSAYACKNLTTQLASWATLRHDTIIYAKQPFGCFTCCDTPTAYVEPQMRFWLEMIVAYRALIDAFAAHGMSLDMRGAVIILARVARICAKQLAGVPLSNGASPEDNKRGFYDQSDEEFLKRSVEHVIPGSGSPYWSGWFMRLFCTIGIERDDIVEKSDALVADVFTDPADDASADPGAILHIASGRAHLMTIAVNSPDGTSAAFCGPVFAYSEFKCPPGTRMTDDEWRYRGERRGLAPEQLLDTDIQHML
jgi:hypothetical protein